MADLKIKEFLVTFSKVVNLFEPAVSAGDAGMDVVAAHENLFQHRATHVFVDKVSGGMGSPGLRYKWSTPTTNTDPYRYGAYLTVDSGMGPKMVINGFSVNELAGGRSENDCLIQLTYNKDFNGFTASGLRHHQDVMDKLQEVVELCDAELSLDTIDSYKFMTIALK